MFKRIRSVSKSIGHLQSPEADRRHPLPLLDNPEMVVATIK
jgi:hypothetical protein